MTIPPDRPRQERAPTYVVQDRNNEEELQRLMLQDHAATHLMGGPLSEQADPSRLSRVLDVGCATGGWAITLAQEYPWMQVTGIDISERMVHAARQQAEQAGVADRVHFCVMDALSGLLLPDHSFDLVNERFNCSYIRTFEWPDYLFELRRVARPGGIVRLTEVAPSA
jgi:ubiquinone/menaquinone biosynthesis C-methylase UbiE